MLVRLRAVRKPRQLMAFLDSNGDGSWPVRLQVYDAAKQRLRDLWAAAEERRTSSARLYARLAEVKELIQKNGVLSGRKDTTAQVKGSIDGEHLKRPEGVGAVKSMMAQAGFRNPRHFDQTGGIATVYVADK